jgi:origin recognition complex subunit 5
MEKYKDGSSGVKASAKRQFGSRDSLLTELEFHMSVSAKYLLLSAFLASRNPATLDAALFDSTGGSDNRKRKRKYGNRCHLHLIIVQYLIRCLHYYSLM